MTSAGKSVYYFGIYLIILGIVLVSVPNILLATFNLPETNEVWIRIVGVLVFNIGVLYVYMAPVNNSTFLVLSCYLRASIIIWFSLFVLMNFVPATLILFGIVDLAGAIWTFVTLRNT